MQLISHRFTLLILLMILISGCATYGSGLDKALSKAKRGDYNAASLAIEEALKPEGADRLLYHLELGVLRHLEGRYRDSNQLFEQAERISEDVETKRLGDVLGAFMSNPRQGVYGGADFEKVFINYYKALNYFSLAREANTNSQYLDAIESARIESRRLMVKLNALNADKGSYQEKNDEDAQLFSQALQLFERLKGNLVDLDRLVYRDDAFAHYLTGITFETHGEYDDARISYGKAALAYEQGFARQFHLGSEMTQQAWFDVVRMMRRSGGFDDEWPTLANKKLTSQQRASLDDFKNTSQLVVIEHLGVVPQRQEMNIELSANPSTRSLILRPYVVGNTQTQLEKLAWFYLVYADKSLWGLMSSYYDASFEGFLLRDFTKTIALGGAWQSAQELGLIAAIGKGLRITVPYYAPPKNKPGASYVRIADRQYALKAASNPAIMGVNEQLLNANSDIQLALSRGIAKSITAQRLGQLAGGPLGTLLSGAGQLAGQLSDAADTRNWLMLPYEVRITRIPLPAGEHEVTLHSRSHSGVDITQQRKVHLLKNELQLLSLRSMPDSANVLNQPMPNTAVAETSVNVQ